MRAIVFMFIAYQCNSALTAKLEETIAVFPRGSDIRLTCYRENDQDSLIWTTSTGDILFHHDLRYSTETKYNNFDVEIGEHLSVLIITDADLDDEGEYFCSDTISKEMVNVSIQVSPTLTMKINGIIESFTPSSSPTISISCSASGARPPVSIGIRIEDGDWFMSKITETSPSGLLWDTIAIFHILLPNDLTGTSVTCQTFGQINVEHINVTQHLSLPSCILRYNTLEVSCNCISNPPANNYLFSIDGEANFTGSTGGTLSVENNIGSEVICYGLSKLGIGKSNVIVVPPTPHTRIYSKPITMAIVVSSVIVVLACLLSALGALVGWMKR